MAMMERLIVTIVGFVREVILRAIKPNVVLIASQPIFEGLVFYEPLLELNMQTNRTDFEAGFALLGLNPNPGANYQGAMSYARQFKKCSILTDVNVSYSASASSSSSVRKASNK